MSQPDIKKVLIVVLDNLGDTVMATALLRPIKNLYPQAEIGLWVKEYSAGIFEDQSMVDTVHAADPPWDRAPGRAKGDWSSFKKVWGDIRREKYDLAFILNTEWRRSLACLLAGIPNRVGYKRRKSAPFLTLGVPDPAGGLPPIEAHRRLFEKWIAGPSQLDLWFPRVELADKEKNWGNRWIDKQGWQSNPRIVIHPFAGDPLKCWPLSHWFELIRLLLLKNDDLRFILCSSKAERNLLEQEMSMMNKKHCQLVEPVYSELKGILGHCNLFVGGDSGPGHVAAALGKPVLSLFGPTDPNRYAPKGRSRVHVLWKNPIGSISVDEVANAALEMV